MHPAWRSGIRSAGGLSVAVALLAAALSGCSTPSVYSARNNFYAGRHAQAEQDLAQISAGDKDEALYLMERGMVRQALAKYSESSDDWRRAADIGKFLETYSISQGAASLVSNDRVLSFRGMPFERILLYSFLAENYIATGNWNFTSVCARNMIKLLENRDGYPDIAYSRYMIGAILELTGDESNAQLQYRTANKLLSHAMIDEESGQVMLLRPALTTNTIGQVFRTDRNGNLRPVLTNQPALKEPPPAPRKGWPTELLCFVAAGRAPVGAGGLTTGGMLPVIDLQVDEDYLGRGYMLTCTSDLLRATKQRDAVRELAKTTARLVVKETLSQVAESQDDLLGAVVRILLYSTEMPDTRQWETLPMWLGVARLPCPPSLAHYTVILRGPSGRVLNRQTFTQPLTRVGNVYVTFCRLW